MAVKVSLCVEAFPRAGGNYTRLCIHWRVIFHQPVPASSLQTLTAISCGPLAKAHCQHDTARQEFARQNARKITGEPPPGCGTTKQNPLHRQRRHSSEKLSCSGILTRGECLSRSCPEQRAFRPSAIQEDVEFILGLGTASIFHRAMSPASISPAGHPSCLARRLLRIHRRCRQSIERKCRTQPRLPGRHCHEAGLPSDPQPLPGNPVRRNKPKTSLW